MKCNREKRTREKFQAENQNNEAAGKSHCFRKQTLGRRLHLLSLIAAQQKHDIDLSVGIQEIEGGLVQGGLRETSQE